MYGPLYKIFAFIYLPFLLQYFVFDNFFIVLVLHFYIFTGNSMYVHGDSNILLLCICDISCYKKILPPLLILLLLLLPLLQLLTLQLTTAATNSTTTPPLPPP